MKYDFLVIGSSGMQGQIVTRDLLESGYKVYCADLYRDGSETNLSKFKGTPFSEIDLREEGTLKKLLQSVDAPIVINCAEGDWNDVVCQNCLEEKKHIIDLGSEIDMTKKQLAMHDDFKKAGLVAITGCGSTPGINNVMMKHVSQFFEEIDTIELGFAWDSNVKKFYVPFSMPSVFWELTDTAPLIENGIWVEKDPQGTEVTREFREIGSQKCYLVAHPETYTFSIDYAHLKPKNIRYYAGFPDHSLETIKKLIELGFGEYEMLPFEKIQMAPVDAMARILTRLKRPEEYTERENLWVEVSGKGKDGDILIERMECIVYTLPGWSEAGCNIDTGMPASIIAQMVLDGRIKARGSFTPDVAVPTEEFFKELKKKGMTVSQNGEAIN
ncbi:MAG TPA: saccharopine dehydrogenase C-terminal domain-containing protein [Candidatus Paceibacterota bacterium]|nr:saccharopine dehydrogenase C-terminal domain-containing protein [Candidatus Paceibacterota bacterium]